MNVKTVAGKIAAHDVNLYTISTCIWCTRLKLKLNSANIKYSYTDIDSLPYVEKEDLKLELQKYTLRLAFPMMFVDSVFIPNEQIDDAIQDLIRDG